MIEFAKKHIDIATKTLKTIDYAHHEIHDGSSFIYNDYDEDVDTASPKRYRITTPNTAAWAHLVMEVTANAAGTLIFYEDPSINAAGSAGTVYNLNRNSSTANTTLVKYDTTTQAPNNDGTVLWQDYIGTTGKPNSSFGGSATTRVEFILKQNEDYILKFTPDADNTKLWVRFIWYEHTN